MKKGERYILIRINSKKLFSDDNLDILDEHIDLLNRNGYVWFLKSSNYDKNINIKLIKEKTYNSRYMIIRDSVQNNSKSYYCEYETMQKEMPSNGYPSYYNSMPSIKGLWIKITKMVKVRSFDELCEKSRTTAGNRMESVLKSSATMVFFECIKDIEY